MDTYAEKSVIKAFNAIFQLNFPQESILFNLFPLIQLANLIPLLPSHFLSHSDPA